jgi:2'-5' RNA ligase
MRCFVAIDLPDDVRAALGGAQARLRAAAPRADVRWVDPGKMHLTLKFLGEVAEERLGGVRDALDRVTGPTCPFAVACTGLGVFPGPSRPRVVWAGITGGLRELGLLAAQVERVVEPLGFLPERRPFRGHITLGRVRSPRGVGPMTRALEQAGGADFGGRMVTEVVLYRSHLSPKGARYEPIARFPLAGRVA